MDLSDYAGRLRAEGRLGGAGRLGAEGRLGGAPNPKGGHCARSRGIYEGPGNAVTVIGRAVAESMHTKLAQLGQNAKLWI